MIEELKITNRYFNNGIPCGNFFAPWMQPNSNSNTMRPDLTGKVNYTLNSHGYRDIEFTPELLNNSIWCVGASDTMGMAVHNTESWPSLLKNYGHTTVNLAIAGAGYDTFSRIVSSMLELYTPKTIILQSATPERREYATDDFNQIVLPSFPKDMLPHDEVWKYYDKSRSQYDMERNITLIKLACKASNTRLIMFDLPNRWDYIRKYPAYDNQHIGPYIHEQISLYLENLLSV